MNDLITFIYNFYNYIDTIYNAQKYYLQKGAKSKDIRSLGSGIHHQGQPIPLLLMNMRALVRSWPLSFL
ncbi:MAG TPA: hypothetical protein VIJ93_12325, partial [bacterium]